MSAVNSALIVGGGPAGLSVAIALRRAGVDRVSVIEITDGGDVIGSELALAGPMLRALDELGVAERCADLGVGIDRATFRDLAGAVMNTQPFPPAHRPGLPPMIGITRPNLHRVLAEKAVAAGATIRNSISVASLHDNGEGVDVELSDGGQECFDLVVAAEGVGSPLRRQVLPDAPSAEYVGQAAWRARVPRRGDEPLLSVSYGPHAKPGLITVSAEHAYLFCLVTTPRFERIPRDEFPARLRAELADFGGPIADIRDDIVDPDHIHYSPLTPILVQRPWHSGRVVLVGDAVHATTPHLAYGAGLAVEDGVVLGEVIATQSDLDAALESFTERRFERCRMVVENGVQLSRWEQNPQDPGADFIGLTGRSLGALTAAI